MSARNRLDLQILGSQPVIMPKNLLDHWLDLSNKKNFRSFAMIVEIEIIFYTQIWRKLGMES